MAKKQPLKDDLKSSDLYKKLHGWRREGAVSFDTGLREADFEYWLEFRTWTVHQAIGLSLGKDPRAVSFETASKGRRAGDHESIFLNDYKPRLEVILNWIGSSELPSSGGVLYPHLSQIDPKEFVNWATSRGWGLPKELEGLANATDLLSDEASNPEEFKNIEGLTWADITLTLLRGDDLEASAAGLTRRVSLSELNLISRRGTKKTNERFVLLNAWAQGGQVSAQTAKSIKHHAYKLRRSLKTYFGITTNPLPLVRGIYTPQFHLLDRRDAGDKRAKESAERKTVSFDEANLAHQGSLTTGPASTSGEATRTKADEYPIDESDLANDPAAEFLSTKRRG